MESPSAKRSSGKRKAEHDLYAGEKRAASFRKTCSIKVKERIARAQTQRLYLITRDIIPGGQSFSVLGSTGNVYIVAITTMPSCTCPDHANGNICKHLLWVFLKVLRVPPSSHVIYQKALLPSELAQIFGAAPPATASGVLASDAVRSAFATLTGRQSEPLAAAAGDTGNGAAAAAAQAAAAGDGARPLEEDDQCPICFEELAPGGGGGSSSSGGGSGLDFCRRGCRRSIHRDCNQRWLDSLRGKGQELTCVYCRQPWETSGPGAGAPGGAAAVVVQDGYVNMAALSGQDSGRDMSSYNEFFQRRMLAKERRSGSHRDDGYDY